MNAAELPMILFTVLAQMSVGAFLWLGAIDLLAPLRFERKVVSRVVEPAIYAIGPTLVVGLFASIFHMNDIFNMFNVVRHWDSSWLSREIIFGVGFAGAGFVFAVMQWFHLATQTARRILAGVTALLGIGLLWSMSAIYSTLVTVPAWNTWVVPFQFFATAILLGGLAVGSAMMIHILVRTRRGKNGKSTSATNGAVKGSTEPASGHLMPPGSPKNSGRATALLERTRTRAAEIASERFEPASPEWTLTSRLIRWIAVVTGSTGTAIIISYVFHVGDLASGTEAAQVSAAVFSGAFFTMRLALLAVSAVLLAYFAINTASKALTNPRVLTTVMVAALAIALIAELMGRYLHYESMFRIGI